MRAPHRSLLASFLLSGLALGSCGEKTEDAAQSICDLIFECDCQQTKYADVGACVADYDARFDKEVMQAKAIAGTNGLTFNQGCADQRRRVPADLGCNLEGTSKTNPWCNTCALVHGNKAVDAACTAYGVYNDCAANLYCIGGVCVDNMCGGDLAAGAPCDPTSDQDACRDGLYCSPEAVCTLLPTIGKPCTEDNECSEGLDCRNDDDTCQPLATQGELCDDLRCADNLYCSSNFRCNAIPGENEPCPDYICGPDLDCEANVCVRPPAVGEPCSESGKCREDAYCEPETGLCTERTPAVCVYVVGD